MPLSFLKRITDPELLFKKVQKIWAITHEAHEPPLPNNTLVNTLLLERLAQNKHTLFMIVDAHNLDITYVGKNAEEFIGYSADEFLNQKFGLVFKIMRWEHISFFIKILDWAKIIRVKIPDEAKKEFMSYSVCGLVFKHKNGTPVKSFCRVYPIELSPNGYVNIAIIEIIDVTNLLKSDDYWVRVAAGKEKQHTLCFFSNNKSSAGGDLISEREMDVLKLIAEGFQSREIAEKLFISPSTVEKHRKNMIARVGVRDTVALVEICKRCGIL